MSLEPRTRALLERAKIGFEPLREDGDRVEAAVLTAIGASAALGGALGTAGAAKVAGGLGGAFAKMALLGAVVVSAAIGGTVVLTRSAPGAAHAADPTARAVIPAPAPVVDTPSEIPSMVAPLETAAAPAPPPAHAPSPSKRAIAPNPGYSSSSVAEEVAFVREGTSHLHAGDAVRALSAFDAHASAFPHGVLEEERCAGRVLALCALGRVSDARAQAEELRAAHPASAHALRIRQSCVGSW